VDTFWFDWVFVLRGLLRICFGKLRHEVGPSRNYELGCCGSAHVCDVVSHDRSVLVSLQVLEWSTLLINLITGLEDLLLEKVKSIPASFGSQAGSMMQTGNFLNVLGASCRGL
jgi:hypothetical protein